MNKLFKYLLYIVFLLSFNFSIAHDPQISSLRLNIYEKIAILELTLSQYGIEQALIKKYPDLDLKNIKLKKLEEVIINYLKETIVISANGNPLKISTGIIKLQNHQSDLKFKIENLPKDLHFIDVDAHCFKENNNQTNFLTVIQNELTAKTKLSKENNFKNRFIFDENKITVANNNTKNTSKVGIFNRVLIAIITSILLIALFILYKVRKKKQSCENK